jgi:iron complex outermembrane receptor protein
MIRYQKLARVAGRLLAVGALTLATGGVAVHAQAQKADAASSSADAPELQEVVVTGSLIKRPAAETAEAITILKADDFKNQGIVNVEQVMNTLTSSAPAVNIASNVGSFSGGGTYANLRHLGNGNTLVLLDGQRLAPNALDGAGVDLSGIPFSAISSVEVLREGASALYGSDAIAGVINFITKKTYQGAEMQMNFDHPQQAGGGSGEADFIFGHGDLSNDGYNFMITGSYSKQQELRATQRGFSAEGFDPALGVINTNTPGSWPGNVIDSNGNLYQSGYPTCAGNPQLTTYYGDCSYRYSAATDLLPESHEASAMAVFTKALPANNTLKVQYFYSQSEVNGYSGPMFYEIALDPASPYFPTPSQLICNRGSANCGSPLNLTGWANPLPAGCNGKEVVTPTCSMSPVTAVWTDPDNSRYGGALNVAQRVLLTFSGSNGGWDYSSDAVYSKYVNDNRWTGGTPNEYLSDVPGTPALAPNRVLSDLINPFGPQSAAGQALINSSYINGTYQIGEDTLWSIDSHATHSLGEAFNAGTPATVALGATINGERFTQATTPYNEIVTAATGLTASSVEGSRSIKAVYIELDAPITKGLDLDVSDRDDRYSDFGTTNNAKVSVRYQPIDSVTFRGAASTGFRAPTLFTLYTSPFLSASDSPTMGSGNPFCSPGHYTAEWSPAVCGTQGLGLSGGNKNLQPITSQNFDLGVIVSPIQDMGITLDYYRIIVKSLVQNVPASAIYADPTGLASYIVTNSSGTLTPSIASANQCTPYTAPTCGYINQNFQNTGRIATDGFDLSIQYLQHTSIGTFHEDLEGTTITQFLEQQYTGGPNINLVGSQGISLQLPAYRWEHDLRVDWTSPESMWSAGLTNRFYSSYTDEYPDGAGNQRTVGSYSLWDAYASVKPVKNLTVLFGIKNLFDTNPPYTNALQANFAAGYNSLVVDPLLRNFYINLKYTFF